MRVPLNDTGGAFTCLHFAYSAGAICPRFTSTVQRDLPNTYIKVYRARTIFEFRRDKARNGEA